MPPHRVYVEPCLGGGSVALNKSPVELEVVGDIDPLLMDFWGVLAVRPDDLAAELRSYRYSEASLSGAGRLLGSPDRFERAVGFAIRSRMSRGGLGEDFAWSDRLRGKRSPGGPIPGDLNAWNNFLESIPIIASRARPWVMSCGDGAALVARYDSPETLVYWDPPYLPEVRSAPSVYAHEMDEQGHRLLLLVARGCRSKVMISSYRSPLYDEFLSGWRRVEYDMPNHSGQGKSKARRTECLYLNF